MIAVGASTQGVSPLPNPTVLLSQNNVVQSLPITTEEEKIRQERAKDIDTLLASYDSPLTGYGEKFVIEAEKNGIDWRLLPAIAGIESTFGRHACKKATNSFLGYGSCKMDFKSVDEAIERVSASLGGNLKSTEHHYEGKTTPQILRKYNSVIPDYPSKVIRIMKMINKEEDIV